MNLLKKLFRIKTAPQETVVPDELVKHYPDPPEKLQTILQRVPNTGIVLYQYIKRFNISKESKYWAMDMMEKGLETPGIVQLAGEDLNMNPFAYSELLDTIFLELGIEVQPETAYCAYAVEIANEVLRWERTARSGFELLSRAAIDTGYEQPFYDFYLWLNHADELVFFTVEGSGLRMDNVEEWMHLYFEKIVQVNYKYSSLPLEEAIYQMVKTVIDDLDLYSLLAGGAPADEFDRESREIACRISKDTTPHQIAGVMADVFNEAFDLHAKADEFTEPANTIWTLLQSRDSKNE